MKIISTPLDGVFEIENRVSQDHRGSFVKTFNSDLFSQNALDTDFRESFYSVSEKNVLRGMHYQRPPCDHAKLVYVLDGEILDVAVDIRKESKTFGQHFSTTLSSENAKSLYLAKGFAHGFLTLSNQATVVYLTTTVYSPDFDTGIRWDSFGFNWPTSCPILSKRDESFMCLYE
tara:strand:- start:248 stop:769 length:522 start_codon:yes stop_codon:yes gene_type:complete